MGVSADGWATTGALALADELLEWAQNRHGVSRLSAEWLFLQ